MSTRVVWTPKTDSSINGSLVIKSGGSTYYENIDDTPSTTDPTGSDGVSTYIQFLGATLTDAIFGLDIGGGNTAIPSGTSIASVDSYISICTGGFYPGQYRMGLKISGTIYYDQTSTYGSPVSAPDFGYVSKSWTVNPATGGGWTYAALNAIEGLVVNGIGAAKGYSQCSQIYIVIKYDASAIQGQVIMISE